MTLARSSVYQGSHFDTHTGRINTAIVSDFLMSSRLGGQAVVGDWLPDSSNTGAFGILKTPPPPIDGATRYSPIQKQSWTVLEKVVATSIG